MADEDLPEIPREYYEAVGELCAAWATLEFVTEQTIWGILEIDLTVGHHITSKLDMRGRWQLLLSIASALASKDDQKRLKDIHRPIPDLTDDRNLIIHGWIFYDTSVGKPEWLIARGWRARVPQNLTLDMVTKTAEAVTALGSEMIEFNRERGYYQEPFHRQE